MLNLVSFIFRNFAMRYLVVIEKTKTGYSAYVPDLPGCITVGETREETENNIQEAILLHIEGMKEDGEPIPPALSEGMNLIIPETA